MNQSLWHVSASQSELRDVERPAQEGLVAIDGLYSMISTGSERLVALGKAAPAGAELDAPYATGDYGFPIKYGYSLVGHDAQSRLVHCLHPHQSTAYVRPEDLFALPGPVSPRRGALLSNMETALNAIWDADIAGRKDVLVCGFGAVGALLANTLRLHNDTSPVVVETDAWRLDKACELGFEAHRPTDVQGEFSRVVHASCSGSGLQFSIDHAATDAIVVELSWYGLDSVTIDLGGRFHRNRVRLVSSQVGTIPPVVQDTVTVAKRKAIAAELLGDASFDALITKEISFGDTPGFFARLRKGQVGDGLIWLIKY
jgi:threonine dehydrogenase-like Zn-dependent dehydrogenase